MDKPIRLLIVDDSLDDALLLVRQLKKGGYNPTYKQVDTAEAMSEALDGQTWDAILCDYSMPNFSMHAALDLYKKKRLDLPFIIVSGTITDETAVAAMKAGTHDYIIKDNLARLNVIDKHRQNYNAEKKFKIVPATHPQIDTWEEYIQTLCARYFKDYYNDDSQRFANTLRRLDAENRLYGGW